MYPPQKQPLLPSETWKTKTHISIHFFDTQSNKIYLINSYQYYSDVIPLWFFCLFLGGRDMKDLFQFIGFPRLDAVTGNSLPIKESRI